MIKKTILLISMLFVTASFAQYDLENAFPNLSFSNPVDFQSPNDGTNRIFVVEQEGRIRAFENSPAASGTNVFLDITSKITSGGELGLLGLAFHPDYQNNGYFYVNYTAPNPRHSVIARYSVSETNPNEADANSELILLTLEQPYSNHNGGQVAFGPDGYLYIAFGDGGSGGDPQGNGQSRSTLLGKILRIDVDNTQGDLNYAIPSDNPFAGNTEGYREEIFAYGLRNPWRFSFDMETGTLWCADVGQNVWEEIDTITNGGNYGWNVMEGNHCYEPSTGCNTDGLIIPVYEYDHSDGCSVTGGYVYKGASVPEISGRYIFADYCSRQIWSLGYYGINPDEPVVEELTVAPALVVSFGTDESNELYVLCFDGNIYKFEGSINSADEKILNNRSYYLKQNYPNPFNPSTTIGFNLPEQSNVKIEIINNLGETVALLTEGTAAQGYHERTWNAENYPSGVYFVRMTAESLSSSKSFQKVIKILLMK